VLRGLEEATRRGMLTVGLAGYDGGKMAEASTVERKNATSPGIRMHGGRLGLGGTSCGVLAQVRVEQP